jgi:hypothetical protein
LTKAYDKKQRPSNGVWSRAGICKLQT